MNLENKDNIELFVQDNIVLINNRISEFKSKTCKELELNFDRTAIQQFLHKKFASDLSEDDSLGESLLEEFENVGYSKIHIVDIAIKYGIYHADLERFYNQHVFNELSLININTLSQKTVNEIVEVAGYDANKKKYVRSIISPIIKKSLFMALRNGFTFNINDIESGVMTANAGDSAQFMFVSRAILAGYNCSNVDVRSSRYDAVIDQHGKLFRVQVKGISNESSLSFKDRDRGGKGIDASHERNKGKRITSKDCDIYVAVDKQTGICYIIPISQVEEWNVDSISVNKVQQYKENWAIIDQLVTVK